jgi:hypothetical protein
MLANYGNDSIAAGTAYCGLEAVFTAPDGRTATLYLADAFDDAWVLTPTSIDVVWGSVSPAFTSFRFPGRENQGAREDSAWRADLFPFVLTTPSSPSSSAL